VFATEGALSKGHGAGGRHPRIGGSVSRISKRFAAAGAIALTAGLALVWLGSAGAPRYQARSRVFATPYATKLFSRGFEARVSQDFPGVLRLEVGAGFGTVPNSAVLSTGVDIVIIAGGSTADEAESAANDCATRLSGAVLTNYGVTSYVTDLADSAHDYAAFPEALHAAIRRLSRRAPPR